MSTSGPMTSFMDCTSFLVMRSNSGSVRSLGSQHTPPLAPPKGTSTTAVFHVFRLDRLQCSLAKAICICLYAGACYVCGQAG